MQKITIIEKIDAFGSNPADAEVKEARAAYNALTPEQRKLVTNLDKLTAAEEALAAAKSAAASQNNRISSGAIAGIVISFVIVLAVIGLLVYGII